MPGRLADKVVLITGAGGGQGRAAAVLFAQEGAKVVVTDIKVEGGQETVQLVKAAGGEAVFQETDVSKAADVEAAVRCAVATYGGLHIMYNNAAVLHKNDTTVTNLEEDMWDFIIGVNLKGVYLGCKYAIPEITNAGGGSVINVSSLAGLLGVGNVRLYGGEGRCDFAHPGYCHRLCGQKHPLQRHLSRCCRYTNDGPRSPQLQPQAAGTCGQESPHWSRGDARRHCFHGVISGLG